MTSFLFIAWATVIIAATSAYFDARRDLPAWKARWKQWPYPQPPTLPSSSRMHLPKWARKLETLLVPLCDIQMVTGIAIITAGFTQLPHISFYHENLVNAYWILTLNSFWAARVDYMDEDSTQLHWGLRIRRAIMLVSCILGVIFLAYTTRREETQWDDKRGPCMNWADPTSNWPWVAGLSLYCLALTFLIVPWTQEKLLRRYLLKSRNLQESLIQGAATDYRDVKSQWVGDVQTSRAFLSSVYCFCFRVTASVLLWIFLNFMAVFAYGEGLGFRPLSSVFYSLFNIWTTFNIVILKILNDPIVGNENTMGFGQVLPLVLILSVVISTVDVFNSEMSIDRL